MNSNGILVAWLVAASAILAGHDVALAQAPRPEPAAGAQQASPPPDYGGEGAAAEATQGAWAPVLKITGIEVMRSVRPPALDVIRVQGVTSTDAWEDPQLVPLTRKPSPDGVLELLLVARAPTGAANPTAFGKVEAIFAIEPGHPYAKVRVRGATNSVLLPALPGWVESPPPVQDCSGCVGKMFVAKGASPPAGVAAGDLVREEDLPSGLRVLKPADGVAKFDPDPNRLTLVLGDSGRIVFAVWD